MEKHKLTKLKLLLSEHDANFIYWFLFELCSKGSCCWLPIKLCKKGDYFFPDRSSINIPAENFIGKIQKYDILIIISTKSIWASSIAIPFKIYPAKK